MIRVSVAMITYNGEKYVKEQLDSILDSIGEQDEIVISDDGSTDGTLRLLEEYAGEDGRIRILQGPGKGVKANVNHVLRECQGKYIFLADQDDIWMRDKVRMVLDAFVRTGCRVVVHDAFVVKADGKTVIMDSFYSLKHSGSGMVKNIWRNTYIGCCMAFRRELLEYVLPIPEPIEMHDQWIGVINDITGNGTCFLGDKLLYYRRHEENQSVMHHYGIQKMFQNRMTLIHELRLRRRQFSKGLNY